MGLVHGEAPGFVMMPLQLDGGGALIVSTLPAGANLIGRVDARGGDKIFSFISRVSDGITALVLPAGTSNQTVYTAPANRIAEITNIVATTNSATMTRLIYGASGHEVYEVPGLTPGTWKQTLWTGHLWLAPGETVFATVVTATAGDLLYVKVHGYLMQT